MKAAYTVYMYIHSYSCYCKSEDFLASTTLGYRASLYYVRTREVAFTTSTFSELRKTARRELFLFDTTG